MRIEGTVVPRILLEGDRPTTPVWGGPGQRYVLGPGVVETAELSAEPELPEAYGTKALFLTACEPRGLCAYWDFTRAQLRFYNQRARGGHLTLRIYREVIGDQPHVEVSLYPDSRYWFVPVGHAGARYVGELGYYRKRDGAWVSVVRSETVMTPPEPARVTREPVRFMFVPAQVPLSRLGEEAEQRVRLQPALVHAVAEAREHGESIVPVVFATEPPTWTAGQEERVRPLVEHEEVRRGWAGSVELMELVRRGWQGLPSSAELVRQPVVALEQAVSSPVGGAAAQRPGFWFNIHAELVVYGATEPDARVTLGGRPLVLRPDGSFSCRFALPDGRYELEAVAVKADGLERRAAVLTFQRSTRYQGEVMQAPADSSVSHPPEAPA
ncbi:MAG: DUF4912 domain-containing protein [Verrucomicrobiota bacterium]|nr:DUF4912 domain-containing protein [Limisphaera sp.]MDW8382308.1 DUF4912 domain-containing protein [Verrucomicrobiota bacterium]